MSTQTIYQSVTKILRTVTLPSKAQHLDIGSGNGELIKTLRQQFDLQSCACDYTAELMKLEDVTVDVVNLNHQPLPYADQSFHCVTATEVIEHLEHYRETLREIHRVLKPGGIAILTTPNVLNIRSRLRYLFFGFYNLFGPLPIKHSALYSTGGHINPVSFFYVAHSLYDANFDNVKVAVDKWQRSSMPAWLLLWLPIKIMAFFAMNKEKKRYKTLSQENLPLVQRMNDADLLMGRTIVVSAQKPS